MEIGEFYLNNMELLELADGIVHTCYSQDYYHAAMKQKELVTCLSSFFVGMKWNQEYMRTTVPFLEETYMLAVMKELLAAQENKDYIQYGDILESELIPVIRQVQLAIAGKEGCLYEEARQKGTVEFIKKNQPALYQELCSCPIPDEEVYRLEQAQDGRLTLKIVPPSQKPYYLHSSVSPMAEARRLVREYTDVQYQRYIVFGLGMGYHIIALLESICDAEQSKVEIYESDRNILKLACLYGLPPEMQRDNVHVIYDPELSLAAAAMGEAGEDTGILLHYPSVRNIQNPVIRNSFERIVVQDSSIRNQKSRMTRNYQRNLSHAYEPVDHIRSTIAGKDVFLVAAGPSLDKNLSLLQEKRKNGIVMAVGTVYGKLIKRGIVPDYAVFLDAGERTIAQMEGMQAQKTPVILASTAYHRLVENYQGKVYLAFQEGYELSRKEAALRNCTAFSSGGSVSTLILDIAIRFQAKRVICLGLDLAYTDNMSHAKDTMDCKPCSMEEAFEITAFDGGKVYTSNLFMMYREWMEKRIQKEDAGKTLFLNATEGGARIYGMQHCCLKEI